VTEKTTHFGYATVDEQEKASKVRQVFDSVASRYDVMNDLMSLGLHRVWKAFTVGQAAIRPGMRVLDVAGGTADLGETVCWMLAWRNRRRNVMLKNYLSQKTLLM